MKACDISHTNNGTASSRLGPVNQPKSLKQVAYESLHQAILSGLLVQEKVYTERELAKTLSISRTPVREALLELAAKDLVVLVPRKGVKVKTFQRNDWEEIFELRQALEVAAVEKITGNVSSQDIQAMKSIVEQQRICQAHDDGDGFLYQDRLLHGMLCELTANQRLIKSYTDLLDLIQVMGVYPLHEPGRMKEVIEEHLAIIEGIQSNNPSLSRKAIKYHLTITQRKGLNFC